MPAPTANKTAQFDASDTDHIWNAWQATSPYHNGVPADGFQVQVWDEDGGADISLVGSGVTANLASPAMGLPSLKFDGSTGTVDMTSFDHPLTGYPTSNRPLSFFISPTAFVVGAAFRIIPGSADQGCLYTTPSAGLNITIRNSSGVYALDFSHLSATPSYDAFTISPVQDNTNYVAIFWLTANVIHGEVYHAGGLLASGSTASFSNNDSANPLMLCRNYNGSIHGSFYLGEMVFYNAYVSTDKTALASYLSAKWLAASGTTPVLNAFIPPNAYVNPSVPIMLVGVAFTGLRLDGTGGAFSTVAGFAFSNISIAAGGASGTVDMTIAAAQAPGPYNFTFTTTGGSSSGTSNSIIFTVGDPAGSGGGGGFGGNNQFNAGFN